jgi:hypothetical protein
MSIMHPHGIKPPPCDEPLPRKRLFHSPKK